MNEFCVALLQLLPEETQEGNLQKGLEACRRAKAMGADLALFPEVWNIGYRLEQPPEALAEAAIGLEGPFLQAFRDAAAELDMAVAVTYLERFEPLPRNTVTVFDRHGREVLTYAKVHTCDFGDECRLTPGDGFYTAELDTKNGPVAIGTMICYDREFPESARVLMLQGAEVILVPNACPMEVNRLSQLRARAFENMVGIATCNYPYDGIDCNGHSTAFDGVAYGEIRRGDVEARDTLVVEAGEAEGIYLAAFPLDTMRRYRAREVHGNAYRRPSKYALLLSEEVRPPFLREDARRG